MMLHGAAANGATKAVKLLLELSADIDEIDAVILNKIKSEVLILFRTASLRFIGRLLPILPIHSSY